MARNRKILFAKCAAILTTVPVLIYAYSSGPNPGYSGVPGELGDCTACHQGIANSGSGSVSISFPNGLNYIPGLAQHLKVTVQDPAQQRWGFQLTARTTDPAAQAGSFTPGSDRFTRCCAPLTIFRARAAQILQYIEHTSQGTRFGTQGSATFEFNWTPPAANAGNIVIYVAGNAANGDGSNFGDHIYTKTYTLTPQSATTSGKPTISRVENGAGFQGTIAAGSWLDIKGKNLATVTGDWSKAISNGNLPTQLPGSKTTVTVNGKPAYVYYVSPTQINALAPADTSSGNVQVVVTNNGQASDAATTVMQEFSPAFFTWPGNYAVATYQNFTYAVKSGEFQGVSTIPAKPGDVIILWGTGFGPTSPAAPNGKVVPFDNRVYTMTATPKITVGGMPAQYFGGALAPGNAGLCQLAIQVPNLSDGDWPVVVEIGGISSPAGCY